MPSHSIVTLDYNGSPIHLAGDMLSLTDMWKVAGSDPARRPSIWIQSADAQRFIGFLVDSLNVKNSDVSVSRHGRGGGTMAHWQVGLAYAKYLSPEFHAWCNGVVRQRMEGKVADTAPLYREIQDLKEKLGAVLEILPELVAAARKATDSTERRLMVSNFETMKEILHRSGFRKRKRGLVQMCSKACWAWMEDSALEHHPKFSAETGIRLFQVDIARSWIDGAGKKMIKDFINPPPKIELVQTDLPIKFPLQKRKPNGDPV